MSKPTLGEFHQALLSSELTVLIIVDHQVAFNSCFDGEALEMVEEGVAELVVTAVKIGIPIITSLVKTNLIGSKLSVQLEQKIPLMARFNRNGANPWDDSEFEKAVQVANRPCLLITGLSVETSLSFTVLYALAMGFDVFVIRDTCLGYSEQSIDISFEWLVQAGAVPVSWRQVMVEWQHKSIDVGLLRRVLKSRRLSKLRKGPTI